MFVNLPFSVDCVFVGQFFLPNYRACSMDFLRDVLSGEKDCFLIKDTHPINVPRVSRITVQTVCDYVVDKPKFMKYLPNPDEDEIKGIDRNFLFTIVNTVDPNYLPSLLR